MKIERERFLFLAAALSACGNGSDARSPPASSEPTLPSAVRGEPIPTVGVATPMPPVVPRFTAAPPIAKESTSTSAEDAPVTGDNCDVALNRVGRTPVCKIEAPPGPTCEGIDATRQDCWKMSGLLKPRIAQAAVECMNRKSRTSEICDFPLLSCAHEALAVACVDPSTSSVCKDVMRICAGRNEPALTEASCAAAASSILDSKRTKFTNCITEACGFASCLGYL